MPPSATLFNANGDTLAIGPACRNIPTFGATHAQTTQSYLLLFDAAGCPVGALVPCGVAWTGGARCHLGPWADRVVSTRRRDLPAGFA